MGTIKREGWIFTKEEIDNFSPSRKDGIGKDQEDDLRRSYCFFVKNLGRILKLPISAVTTAIFLCHRFYMRQSHSNNDRFIIATACVLIAVKNMELERKQILKVTQSLYKALDDCPDLAVISVEKRKQLILHGERLVLSTLEFDLDVDNPYKYLLAAVKQFKVDELHPEIMQWSIRFLDTGLMTPLCLQFKSQHFAGAAFYMAYRFLKVQSPSGTESPVGPTFQISPSQLAEIYIQAREFHKCSKR